MRSAERSKMVQQVMTHNRFENRYQHLRKADGHFRAEIQISRNELGYQFKLRDIDDRYGCFFISKNSAVLKNLKLGAVVDMKYWTSEKTRRVKYVSAQIKKITRKKQDPFKGHYKVGLSILHTKRSKLERQVDRFLKAAPKTEGGAGTQQTHVGLRKTADMRA